MDAEKVAELKNFVEQCKSNPSIIHNPSLVFFKTYLQSLGARIPPAVPKSMGYRSIEVTEENRDASQILKSKAMDSISEDKLHEAIDHLTEAVMLNPSSSILYATRASVYVKLSKPIAAIRDADAALQINPDSAKGYKIRGMARAMLGQWEAAAKDLHVASNLDYDEEIGMVLKKVEPNAHKIEEHRRKYERLHKEREQRKIEHERKQRRGEAKYEREMKMEQPSESKASDPEAASALKEGQVIGIHSAGELEKMLKAASKSSRLAVLYFTATWCGPCRFISPLFTTLAGKYQKVVFLKVDIDEATDAAARWNISSVPSFFFIKNEEEIDKVVGADKSSLERKIAQYAS
ncbi:TPR repeat-containing thioredoxin TDX [Camellia lanceoleosa]|uniref:TPR repeat-containing thioredoxin TDX n=1 Tax=Camellia lanceoleosa TaxID=1840588 RepID=A0ACC0FES1_9ERIC|nr:TPR repeat-containing thioredoxin TDX [Camellia lanceoleosa]